MDGVCGPGDVGDSWTPGAAGPAAGPHPCYDPLLHGLLVVPLSFCAYMQSS